MGGPPPARTVGELRASGWRSRSVKEELRANAAARIAAGQPLVEGVVGYDDTVLPELERALLAGHDVIFLGERGQAKSRIMRALVGLLDEWVPALAGSELRDDPYRPVSRGGRDLLEAEGDDAPIEWVHRSVRYAEKLATPDTSIADLIGEVDPVKVAEGRYLSDELTIHYGLVPRAQRGIFAVNELPDLPERIQVALLDVLEERDVQIRGHALRLPLDLLLVASANPDDYTSRGRIITPLKDRFGSQVRTHYPLGVDTEAAIVAQEAGTLEVPGRRVVVPPFMTEVVVRMSQLARSHPRVNQRSGVSVRLSIANEELLRAAALARALRHDEPEAAPRVSDLGALVSATLGKLEIEAFGEGEDEEVVEGLLRSALLETYRARAGSAGLGGALAAFEAGAVVHTGPDLRDADYLDALESMPELRRLAAQVAGEESPAVLVSALELVLEGLHLSKRLNKDALGSRATYRSRGR
jgi:magnesium chelatase subunit I